MSLWRRNGGSRWGPAALMFVMSPPSPFTQPTSAPSSGRDRVVAVGLLTQRDIEVLGTGFRRLFPIEDTPSFDDLLRQLDQLPRIPPPRD